MKTYKLEATSSTLQEKKILMTKLWRTDTNLGYATMLVTSLILLLDLLINQKIWSFKISKGCFLTHLLRDKN